MKSCCAHVSKYLLIMELRFDAMFTQTWVTEILMRAVSNVHEGRVRPAGGRFPTPGLSDIALLWWCQFGDSDLNSEFVRLYRKKIECKHAGSPQAGKGWKPLSWLHTGCRPGEPSRKMWIAWPFPLKSPLTWVHYFVPKVKFIADKVDLKLSYHGVLFQLVISFLIEVFNFFTTESSLKRSLSPFPNFSISLFVRVLSHKQHCQCTIPWKHNVAFSKN